MKFSFHGLLRIFCWGLFFAAPSLLSASADEPSFRYSDLDSFAQAMAEIDRGRDPVEALRGYLERASPGLKAFVDIYSVTAEKMVEQIKRRPKYFRSLGQLRAKIQAMEPAISAELRKLAAMAPDTKLTPVYYFVAQRTAGGTARATQEPDGSTPRSILVAVELLGMDETTDMAEFTTTGRPDIFVRDIPYVVVHEMVHVLQVQAQGSDNYVSIYRVPEKGTLLAYAVREGAGDFFTHLVSGRRLGSRHIYCFARESELWAAFSSVMHESQGKYSEWFSGGKSTQFPDLPMQTGYFIGMQICQAYYDSAPDKQIALRNLLTAHTVDEFAAIVAPYAARFAPAQVR